MLIAAIKFFILSVWYHPECAAHVRFELLSYVSSYNLQERVKTFIWLLPKI